MSEHEHIPDDATILAWIEGELAPDRHRDVTRAIARQPALQARADAMRLDRFTLRALGDERAPAGLLDSVADLLERELLVTISDGLGEHAEAIDGQARPSAAPALGDAVVHDPATGLRRVQRKRSLRPLRYALAAGLLMVVGASAWFGGMMFAQRERATPSDLAPIARADGAGEVESKGLMPGVESGLAMGEAIAPTESAALPAAVETTVSLARAEEPMTIERARELLLERRLIVRARMADLSGLAWIDGVSERVALERDVPAELAIAVAPDNETRWPEVREASLLLAGDASVGPPIELTVRDQAALPERVAASIVLVELDARSLEEAIRGLRAQRGIVSVELEEAGSPLPGLGDGAEGAFWWRESSDRWTPSAIAPIVFEVLR